MMQSQHGRTGRVRPSRYRKRIPPKAITPPSLGRGISPGRAVSALPCALLGARCPHARDSWGIRLVRESDGLSRSCDTAMRRNRVAKKARKHRHLSDKLSLLAICKRRPFEDRPNDLKENAD